MHRKYYHHKNERECFQRYDEEGGTNINGIAPTCM